MIEPQDRHNADLVANVHPADWKNPVPSGRYNLVVVGAGTAGLISAIGSAGLGAKVALVERHLMGGDCLNVGCVPSKGLIAAAKAAARARRAGEFGVKVSGVEVDFPAVMERMRRLRAQISKNDSAARYTAAGVDVYLGPAEFTGRNTLRVGETGLEFKRAIIATGARAVDLPIPGLQETGVLTNETLFELTELPRRLAVIGAGPIGVEMAQSFARFGSEVTLFEGARRILIREDADAAAVVHRALEADGVRIVAGCTITGLERRGAAKVVKQEGAPDTEVDAVLVAVGRAPNVEGLGLEAAGVAYDKSGVLVDDALFTSNRDILAVGDIASKFKFTHMADALARIAIQNALFPGPKAKESSLTVPWCTYTDPEVAHVGEYEGETFMVELADVDRAILDGETDGFVKVHVKPGGDRIVGATVVAAHAGDLISELSVAMRAGLGLGGLAKVIHPYPTQAEAIKRAADAYNRTKLTPLVKTLFAKWLSWR